jgi:hypothetical protein
VDQFEAGQAEHADQDFEREEQAQQLVPKTFLQIAAGQRAHSQPQHEDRHDHRDRLAINAEGGK